MRADVICLIVKDYLMKPSNRVNFASDLLNCRNVDPSHLDAKVNRIVSGLSQTIKTNTAPDKDVAIAVGGFLWGHYIHFALHLFHEEYSQALNAATGILVAFGRWAGIEIPFHHVQRWALGIKFGRIEASA